jgi:DNA-binding NtrC family response regulator
MAPHQKSVFVVSPQKPTIHSIKKSLEPPYRVHSAVDLKEALDRFNNRRYEFTFIDINLFSDHDNHQNDQNHYHKTISGFFKIYPAANIVVICPQKNIRQAVYAMKAGAMNYVVDPIDPEEVKFVTETIHEGERIQSELDYLRDQFWETEIIETIRTNNAMMKKVYNKVRSVAPTKTTVLLCGDTGTGKGVIASLIHSHSNRREMQFIGLHCGAIPDTLLESELFGHEKGAFTGAFRRKLGKFEIAHGGTIFLDEIATISASAQIKLLKVLQDKTFQHVGGEDSIESDARIIAATNMDLQKMMEDGSFRKDLYYRLNVFPIEIPTLAERKEDIPLLVEIFLKRLNQYYTKDIYSIHPLVMEAFQEYSWPGNIRELENIIERSYIIETGSVLSPETFPAELFTNHSSTIKIDEHRKNTLAEVRRAHIAKIERQYLKEVLTHNKGRINLSAKHAGVSTRQLHKLLKKYNLYKEEFK